MILLFYVLSIFFVLSVNSQDSLYYKNEELLLCRKCGADIADTAYIFNKISPGAHKIEKQNLFGLKNVTSQALVNPFGVNFEIITIQKARCDSIGSKHGADSWFPGYSWRICTCPHCKQHLGWTFEINSANDSEDIHKFHGLIISNILGENFTDSLLVLPKIYRM